MALEMDKAAYARGGHGEDITLKTEITQRFLKLKNAIKGPDYQALIRTIQDNWEGSDSEKFQAVLAEMAEDFKNHVIKTESDLIKAIDDDRAEFASFQNKNAGNINKPNIW